MRRLLKQKKEKEYICEWENYVFSIGCLKNWNFELLQTQLIKFSLNVILRKQLITERNIHKWNDRMQQTLNGKFTFLPINLKAETEFRNEDNSKRRGNYNVRCLTILSTRNGMLLIRLLTECVIASVGRCNLNLCQFVAVFVLKWFTEDADS